MCRLGLEAPSRPKPALESPAEPRPSARLERAWGSGFGFLKAQAVGLSPKVTVHIKLFMIGRLPK